MISMFVQQPELFWGQFMEFRLTLISLRLFTTKPCDSATKTFYR